MANSKEIKTQIASISNTQKITSAMEKVAVSKMKKTQDYEMPTQFKGWTFNNVIGHLHVWNYAQTQEERRLC